MGPIEAVAVRCTAWVSLVRGAAGLAAPRLLARVSGTTPDATRTRVLFGLREAAIGVALLHAGDPAPWLRARVAGDVVDVALHGRDALDPARRSGRTVAALGLVLASAMCDLWLLRRLRPPR